MTDLSQVYGSDITIGPNGDLLTSDGSDEITQRIVRRLCTVLGAYVWNSTYGAGLPAQVGGITNVDQIQGIVNQQIALEAGVDQTQPVTVALTSDQTGDVAITITYTDAATGTIQEALVPLS